MMKMYPKPSATAAAAAETSDDAWTDIGKPNEVSLVDQAEIRPKSAVGSSSSLLQALGGMISSRERWHARSFLMASAPVKANAKADGTSKPATQTKVPALLLAIYTFEPSHPLKGAVQHKARRLK
jgi:hypothetical protein